MNTLRGRTAAVTGAASGLGRAMALAFADEGMHLALADVDEHNLHQADRQLNAARHTLHRDERAACDERGAGRRGNEARG